MSVSLEYARIRSSAPRFRAAGAFVDLHLGKCAFIEPPPVGEFCHKEVRPICDKILLVRSGDCAQAQDAEGFVFLLPDFRASFFFKFAADAFVDLHL